MYILWLWGYYVMHIGDGVLPKAEWLERCAGVAEDPLWLYLQLG